MTAQIIWALKKLDFGALRDSVIHTQFLVFESGVESLKTVFVSIS